VEIPAIIKLLPQYAGLTHTHTHTHRAIINYAHYYLMFDLVSVTDLAYRWSLKRN